MYKKYFWIFAFVGLFSLLPQTYRVAQTEDDIAPVRKLRLLWKGDASTTATIAFDYRGGSKKDNVVFYDTVDHGRDVEAYSHQATSKRHVNYKGMRTAFTYMEGLLADTVYYFVICTSQGIGQRFWFRTAPANADRPMTFIAGGDSRNNRSTRRNANLLVAKLRADAVLFGGDMTSSGKRSQWRGWFDDWQLTIAKDGRVTPLIVVRGNHEVDNSILERLFDIGEGNYYSVTMGGDLLKVYGLNSESAVGGDQKVWLKDDLKKSQHFTWRNAIYHKPMRPHTSGKSEGNRQYNAWAKLFYDYGVRLAIESDSHTVKTTYPVRPDQAGELGFIREDERGIVFVGEGCWGAPLRSNNDDKVWTRASGRFNQVKWYSVDTEKIELRTVKVDNASDVESVSDDHPFDPPANIIIWDDGIGESVIINRSSSSSELVAQKR
jgi:acid phosphatase type 7